MNGGAFKLGEVPPRTWSDAEKAEMARVLRCSIASVEEGLKRSEAEMRACDCFINDVYQVFRRVSGAVVHLSIRRLDREPCRDWRDFQEIKNELVGPEHEGIELYPAESRLVDSANQYHLWVLAKEGERIEVGFNDGRVVMDDVSCVRGAKQRPRKENR